jgi:Phosphatidylinositol-4-phosphate 5-Kinase
MDEALQPSGTTREEEEVAHNHDDDETTDRPIATWTYCQHCRKVVTPLTFISDLTWKFSFGKFLEVFFYNRDAILNAPAHQCSCNLQTAAMLYFGCGKLGARFTYERITPYGVFVRKTLPFDVPFHKKEAMCRLDLIAVESSTLFINFDKHIEKISREARSLFNSAMNRPEHLQTVLSELNKIGSEVDHTAMILHEKIAAVAENCRRSDNTSLNGALFLFPLFARRYLFNVTAAWNEKLSAAGQAISAMKRIAAASSGQDGSITPNVTAIVSDSLNEELSDGMKRLRQLIEHYARYNITDITLVLPSQQGNGISGDTLQDGDFDEDFDDPDTSMDFADGIDADVIASRRRLKGTKLGQLSTQDRPRTNSPKPTKSLGTRRTTTDATNLDPSSLPTSTTSAPPKPTPGGAVKSAITRFFNRGGRDSDPYVVDLGIFTEGRPRLPPGVDGVFVPVIDEKLSTIIAYSLASTEYGKQFRHFSKESSGATVGDGASDGTTDRNRRSEPKPELDGGIDSSDGIVGRTEHRNIGQAQTVSATPNVTPSNGTVDENKATERRMMNRNKSHIKHTFRDIDEKGQVTCKFVCTTYWATQFQAVRQCFLSNSSGNSSVWKGENSDSSITSSQHDVERCYIESLGSAYSWAASGGKSGANFSRTADDRFVIKCISRTELQMFLESAPAYFEYLCKAFYHGLYVTFVVNEHDLS